MADRGTLTPNEVMERLNRSLEEELSRLEGTFPIYKTPINRSAWGSPAPPRDHVVADTANSYLRRTGNYDINSDPTSDTRTTPGARGAAMPSRRANASLFSKLEASRLDALEALSSVLFEGGDGGVSRSSSAWDARPAARSGVSPGGQGYLKGQRKTERATRSSLEDRLRSKAAALVEEENELLQGELRTELESESKRFAAAKPAIAEEAYRSARLEQASALQNQERELRMILARRELKDLKDATHARLAVAHAQEKERTLLRLRRSLSRGTGHSVGGLRESLWEEAQQKRTRALQEGEATFEHLCRLLRQQWEQETKSKIEAMAEEAREAEEAALAALREAEANATEEELSRVLDALERDKAEAEADLKRQLEGEATTSVTTAVDTCTSRHKLAQQDAAVRASETLKRALQAAAEDEDVRTKTVLEREMRCLEERRSSFVAAVEEALAASSLGTLAGRSRSPPPSPLPTRKPRTQQQEDVGGSGTLPSGANSRTGAKVNAAAARALGAVQRLEGAASAAERAHAKRVRDLVRLRAAAALTQRENGTVSPGNVAASGAQVEKEGCRRDDGGEAVCCGRCAVLFAANERLLEEARSRGFLG